MKLKSTALILALACLLTLLLSCGGNGGNAETTSAENITTAVPDIEDDPVDTEPNTLIFASADFQGRNTVGGTSATGTTSDPSYNDGNKVASDILKRIIQNIKNDGYTHVDSTIFCGDYDIDNGSTASDSEAGIAAVNAVYAEMEWNNTASGEQTKHIFVQGNHESALAVGQGGLSGSNRDDKGNLGAFDTEHYGLYLLHEDYHPYKSSGYTDKKIDAAAAELKEYLDAKLAADYSKPIFIAAHVPLHHNLWMNSGVYAKPFFDVINEAAGKGLSIIYLFGHDHGINDQYLGGTDIFLPSGSVIFVPDRGTKATKQQYTLNFTYMTAGLSAYTGGDHSESHLSGTIFEIYDDRVRIKRYSDATDRADNGLINVGNVGEARPDNTAAGLLHTYYSTEYHSPQTVRFTKQDEITDSASKVTLRAFGITGAEVDVGKTVADGDSRRITYGIKAIAEDGSAYEGGGTVTIPLPEEEFGKAKANELSASSKGKPCAVLSCENGLLRLWVPRFDQIEIIYKPTVTVTCKRVTADELKDGKRYLIVAGQVQSISIKYNKQIVSPDTLVLSSPQRVGLAMADAGIGTSAVPQTLTVDGKYVFTLKRQGDGWMFGKDGEYLLAGNTSGDWASSGDGQYRVRQLKYGANGTAFKITARGNSDMAYISTTVEGGKYPCCWYVTSYGNSCLMDIPRAVEDISPSAIRISFYYIYEVQE